VNRRWPHDPATTTTPVAASVTAVAELARTSGSIAVVDARVSVCRACPRLVAWREEVAAVKRRAFAEEEYWGRPIPGFGVVDPQIIIVGLAPAAHGGNRTGRAFTGDRSGDWLYGSLYRCGLANQPTSVSADDALALRRTRIVAAVRCAPPANRPTPAERDACRPWLARELQLLWPTARVVVVLGGFGWASLWPALRASGLALPARIPPFGHGTEVLLPDRRVIVGCYHVSQQNTFTGKLTEQMLDAIFVRAVTLAGGEQRMAESER
jgi:uracil-DNA glycosylase